MSNEPVNRGSTEALDTLLYERFASSGRWSSLFIAGGGLLFQALTMMIIRGVDGPRANLDGIVARGVTWFVIGAALPTVLAATRLMNAWPGEPWLLVLARLRGISPVDVARRTPIAALRVVMRRAFFMMLPLVLLSIVLSLPEASVASRRVLTGGLFVGLAAASSLFLLLVGWAGARWLGGRGRMLIVALLIFPALFSGASRRTRHLSPSGLYSAANEAVQKIASRDR